ncbi:tripartite tricarboxylate transporter substrate-binding protein [Cupriavidus sp. 8B]
MTSAKRMPLLSAVPTIAGSGYAGFKAEDWKALVAPARTPPEVVARLNVEVNKALAQPDIVSKLREEGSEPRGGSAKGLGTFIQTENTCWGDIVRQSGRTCRISHPIGTCHPKAPAQYPRARSGLSYMDRRSRS